MEPRKCVKYTSLDIINVNLARLDNIFFLLKSSLFLECYYVHVRGSDLIDRYPMYDCVEIILGQMGVSHN